MHIVDTGVPESKKASKDPVVDHKLSTTICSYLEPKLWLSTASNSSASLSGYLHRDNTNTYPFDYFKRRQDAESHCQDRKHDWRCRHLFAHENGSTAYAKIK